MKSLFYLDQDVVFLNHGSFGACPKPVFEKHQTYQLMLERQPVRFFDREAPALIRKSKEKLARFLNAETDNLFFVSNATTAVNIVAQSLNLSAGDEVLSCNHEYGATRRMWQQLSEKQGFSYSEYQLKLPLTSKADFISDFEKSLRPQTKVIFLSHITSPTALILPIKEICEIARARNILTLIDGAHAPGQIPLDFAELNCDFYTGNAHKWMLSAKGSAFLHVAPEVQSLIKPLVISWGKLLLPMTGQNELASEIEYQGTRDFAPFLAIGDAVDFLEEYRWAEKMAEKRELLKYAKTEMQRVLGTEPIIESEEFMPQMYAHPLPGNLNGKSIKEKLYTDFNIEIPVTQVDDTQYIRISVQVYTIRTEVQYFIKSLETVLTQQNEK